MKKNRWQVSGRVQGVGFRRFTLHHARHLNITGNVKNLPDGRVEILVSGPDEDLNAFYQAIEKGPIYSSVKEIAVLELPRDFTWSHTDFRILQ